jgi:hypothetical protein
MANMYFFREKAYHHIDRAYLIIHRHIYAAAQYIGG